MRPRSSPQYALATARLSKNDPVIHPWSFLHSRMKAAEQSWGNNSLIYDPFVTGTNDPSLIESGIHSEINKLLNKLSQFLLCTKGIDKHLFDCREFPQQGRTGRRGHVINVTVSPLVTIQIDSRLTK